MAASQHYGSLSGRLILIVQRTWIITRQLSVAFKAEGARVLSTHDAASGALSADAPDLAAAVLDSGSVEICRKLKDRGIPFVLYTARAHIEDDCEGAPVVQKPALVVEVVEEIRRLL
jgi:DNA-binding response OmpR family regulator